MGTGEIKTNLKTPFSHPSILPRINFSPDFLKHSGTGGWEMGAVVSLPHAVFVAPSSPGSNVESLPQEAVLNEVLQCGPSHGLQSFTNTPSIVTPSGTGCSSLGPPWDHKSYQQTCSCLCSSLQGSQVLSGARLTQWGFVSSARS